MPLTALPQGPWPRGVNLLDSIGVLAPDELSWCSNFRLDLKGFPYKRPGFVGFGTTPTVLNGNNPVTFLHRFYRSDSSKTLVGAAGGKLYKLDNTTGVPTKIDLDGNAAYLMDANNLCSKAVYKDRLYIADGVRPVRYNGTDAPYIGYPAVTGALGQSAGGGLTVGATYKYIFSAFCGNLGEGPGGGGGTITLAGANQTVNITGLTNPNARYEATTIRIYRTLANGNVYYFVAEVAVGTATYNDVLSDATISLQNSYLPVHVPANDNRYVLIGPDERAYWFGRSGINASTIEVSDIGFPDRVIDTDFETIQNNDGDELTGGCRVPGGLLFFKRNSTWFLRQYGLPPILVSIKVGCTAPFSIVEIPGGCMFLSQEGKIYIYGEGKVYMYTATGQLTPENEVGTKLRPEFLGMSEAAMKRVVAVYHRDRYRISYDYQGSKGFNFRTLEFDAISKKWDGPHENGEFYTPSYYALFDSQRDKGELCWGEAKAASGSFVYIQDGLAYGDNGRPISAVGRTGQHLIPGMADKEIVRVIAKVRASEGAYLEISILGDDGVKTTAILIRETTGGSVGIWGLSKWGQATWGGELSTFAEAPFDITARAHQPVLEFTDKGLSRTIKIDEMVLLINEMSLI